MKELSESISVLHPVAQVAAILAIGAFACFVVWGFVKFWVTIIKHG